MSAHVLRMYAACALVVALGTGACSSAGAGDPSLEDVLASLTQQGIVVAERNEVRQAIQQELENMNEAIATGVPIPKLVKRLTLDGIHTDWFVCPGRAEQANAVIAVALRGAEPRDPPYLGQIAEMLTGSLHLAVGRHILSMQPKPTQDDAALRVARALAGSMP